MTATAELYTTVENTSGSARVFGFLGPRGMRLAAGEVVWSAPWQLGHSVFAAVRLRSCTTILTAQPVCWNSTTAHWASLIHLIRDIPVYPSCFGYHMTDKAAGFPVALFFLLCYSCSITFQLTLRGSSCQLMLHQLTAHHV